MRVICIHIDHFAAAVETREHPELLSRPIVIGGFPNERKPVFDCSPQATQLDIRPGMQLRQAYQLCPDAVFIPLDVDRYARAFDEVLDILDQFSPTVEAEGLGRALLDGSGLEGLFGPEEDIARRVGSEVSRRARFAPKIGVGSNKFVAGIAAAGASRGESAIVKPGDERKFLGPLPVDLLPVSEAMKRRLDLLGLRTMDKIAALPPDAAASQFGKEGILAHRLANGNDERPLVPRARPAIVEDELFVENPLETIDALLVAMDRLLDRLTGVLRSRNQVCGEIKLCFHLDGQGEWHESIILKESTDSKRRLLALLKYRLETVHLCTGITAIRLGLAQLGGEEAKQSSLLAGERVRQEEQLRRLARRLQARFGENPLKRVVQVDPDSRIPERRAVLTDCNL